MHRFRLLVLIIMTVLTACTTAPDPRPDISGLLPGEIVVADLMLVEGDLPPGYTIAAEYLQPPDIRFFLSLRNIPKADRVITIRLDPPGDAPDEWVVLQVFVDYERTDLSYDLMTRSAEDVPVTEAALDFGDGVIIRTDSNGSTTETVIYKSCNMVGFIQTTSDSLHYAKALNSRMAPLFCSE